MFSRSLKYYNEHSREKIFETLKQLIFQYYKYGKYAGNDKYNCELYISAVSTNNFKQRTILPYETFIVFLSFLSLNDGIINI